jgi:hypothetical protein
MEKGFCAMACTVPSFPLSYGSPFFTSPTSPETGSLPAPVSTVSLAFVSLLVVSPQMAREAIDATFDAAFVTASIVRLRLRVEGEIEVEAEVGFV